MTAEDYLAAFECLVCLNGVSNIESIRASTNQGLKRSERSVAASSSISKSVIRYSLTSLRLREAVQLFLGRPMGLRRLRVDSPPYLSAAVRFRSDTNGGVRECDSEEDEF